MSKHRVVRKDRLTKHRFSRRVYCPCVECGGDGKPVYGSQAYPGNQRVAKRLYYRCECGAIVGSTKRSGLPAGFPASEKTHAVRGKAHVAFGALLKEGLFPNPRSVIDWLAGQMGVSPSYAFIERMDAATADRVTRLMVEHLHETRRAAAAQDTAPGQDAPPRETRPFQQQGYTKAFKGDQPAFFTAEVSDRSRGQAS